MTAFLFSELIGCNVGVIKNALVNQILYLLNVTIQIFEN